MKFASTLLLLALAVPVARAQVLVLAPGEGTLSFLAHTTLHDFEGRVREASGKVVLDGETFKSGVVRVWVRAIGTGNDGRDERMRSAEYLDGGTHPDIAFKVDGWDGGPLAVGGPKTGKLSGTLTIRGVAKAIEVPVEVTRTAASLHVKGAFPVNLRDYGMEPPIVMLVQRMEPVVEVRLDLTFSPMPG